MLKLVKGNNENLEGKAIVFSRLKIEEETKIFALYLATNPLDFFEKMGIPKEVGDEITRELEEKLSEIKKDKNLKGLEKILPVYASPIPIENEADLYLGEEDVLDAGEFSNSRKCRAACMMGVETYLFYMSEDILKKHNIKLNKAEEKNTEEKKPELNYKDIKKNEMKNYILNKFVTEIMDSRQYGEEKRANYLKEEFVRFSSGAPFASDVLELIRVLDSGNKNPNLELIDSYLTKIVAINEEDYETAAKVRDKIKAMERSQKT